MSDFCILCGRLLEDPTCDRCKCMLDNDPEWAYENFGDAPDHDEYIEADEAWLTAPLPDDKG